MSTPPTPVETATGPLAGVLVADFSRVLAGPLCSMFLADLGATVIKVERPGSGDDTRQWGPPHIGSMSTYFSSVNRNKRSIALDLADAGDRDLARRLAVRADVLLQNFQPGRLARYGLDYDSLCKAHPGLVYCSISGFGAGAGADLPGYDFVVQAVGGLMSITGESDGAATKAGVALVDVLTGLHAAIGVLAALRSRDQDGKGQEVEVNLLSSLLSSLVNQGAGFINGGGVPARMGNRHPSIAPYETLATRDAPLAVAVGNDRQFGLLTAELGLPELAADERFVTNSARVMHRQELVPLLEQALAGDSAEGWTRRFSAAGIACGPVNDLPAAFRLATELGLEPVVTLPRPGTDAVATLASPLRLSRTPVSYRMPPPDLGADSEHIRAWLAADEPTVTD
ncbi:CaiB/BaiF CoA transferase family protein [Streptomyces sp. NPDC101151]|uniref:CaiB/BaiF CoA transferase family protein n=1 Tax=Streptomyces sp. NPDC101151 TaxID=3366115 RepID=UPI003828D5E0